MLKRLSLLVFSLLLCSCAVLYSKDVSCFTWGQASCKVCSYKEIIGEDNNIEYVLEECPVNVETKGLSDNGLNAIVKTITELPGALIKSIISMF